jgi:hypothetical protein
MDMRIPDDDTTPLNVYIIFRVFHVEESPEFYVYLDPWALFKSQERFLRPESYSVTGLPGGSW